MFLRIIFPTWMSLPFTSQPIACHSCCKPVGFFQHIHFSVVSDSGQHAQIGSLQHLSDITDGKRSPIRMVMSQNIGLVKNPAYGYAPPLVRHRKWVRAAAYPKYSIPPPGAKRLSCHLSQQLLCGCRRAEAAGPRPESCWHRLHLPNAVHRYGQALSLRQLRNVPPGRCLLLPVPAQNHPICRWAGRQARSLYKSCYTSAPCGSAGSVLAAAAPGRPPLRAQCTAAFALISCSSSFCFGQPHIQYNAALICNPCALSR